MARCDYAIDHIDPRWKEGRDYQLVCGLNVPSNLTVEESSVNERKSNRFVPYRIVSGIPLHREPGDWGVFLIQGEWRLCQFMGPEWWDESRKIGCGEIIGGRISGKKTGWGFRSTEFQSAAGKIGGVSVPKEVRIANGRKAVSLREECPICGKIMGPANMGRHMKVTHGVKRVRVS